MALVVAIVAVEIDTIIHEERERETALGHSGNHGLQMEASGA